MPSRLLSQGKKAWELYFEKHVFDGRVVRPAVAKSWERCRSLQVNPLQRINPGPDESLDLDERLYRKQQLIRVARPFMRDLYKFVSGSAVQVILTDQDGLLLETIGDKAVASRYHEVHFCPGSTWAEADKGTNAIGTALAENQPVEIYAWEHFCEENHFLTCSAAPIRDPQGNTVGVLDASGDYRGANPHTIGMVVAMARAIENQLNLEQTQHQLYVASGFSNTLVNGVADGIIAINRDGIITTINARGGELLGVPPATAKGQPLLECCSNDAPILQVVTSGTGYHNREFIFKDGRRMLSSASPLHDEKGGIVGAIAFLREVTEGRFSKRPLALPCPGCTFDDIVGESAAIQAVKHWAVMAAACSSTVLILGESGTGKELFARAIHSGSWRSSGPFVAINCAALPETLIESELFGYVGGSFTGANKGGQPGKFELANRGTILLDEIGDMPLTMQAKLLRVLQDKRVSRIGSAQEVEVDVRIIAATNCDLKKEVENGRFREDLYYRLAVLEINVPPLRERQDDIPLLARTLVNRIAVRLKRAPIEIDEDVFVKFAACSWPGNIRAMENAIERAMVQMGDARVLTAAYLDLPDEKAPPAPAPSAQPAAQTTHLIKPLREVERQAIAEALSFCCGNIKETANRLGIARNTVYRKMKDYDLLPGAISRVASASVTSPTTSMRAFAGP